VNDLPKITSVCVCGETLADGEYRGPRCCHDDSASLMFTCPVCGQRCHVVFMLEPTPVAYIELDQILASYCHRSREMERVRPTVDGPRDCKPLESSDE